MLSFKLLREALADPLLLLPNHHHRSPATAADDLDQQTTLPNPKSDKTLALLFVPINEVVVDTSRLASIARDIGLDLHPTPCDRGECSRWAARAAARKLRNTVNRQASTAMGEYDEVTYVDMHEPSSPRATHGGKLSMLPLVFLIFYEVSGGPFGVEDSVQAAGPLLALRGFLVFPFIWSVPEALITAEMRTMFPENGGYVVWVSAALGPYWGFQQGWMKWLSGVIDNALYPVLFLDYLKSAVPALVG